MDTHSDSTITPSAHLPTVEALLEKLDEMRGNVGAKQRLEFLLEKGPEVVPGFDFNDAFDLSHRAHTERVQKLEDLGNAMDVMRARWHDSSLEDEVMRAGDRLIGHLSEFVKQARRQESRFEIETLASLWEDAPNVFPAFGLPTPSYYPEKQVDARTAHHEERQTHARRTHEETLRRAREKLEQEVTEENLEKARLADDVRKKTAATFGLPSNEEENEEMYRELKETRDGGISQVMAGGPADGITTGMIDPTKEALEKHDVRVPTSVGARARHPFEDGRVVGQVERRRQHEHLEKEAESLGHLGLKQHASDEPKEELEPELDMLDIKSWTLAVNSVLVSNWKFDRQLRGRVGDRARMGVTLIWKKDLSELRLDIERLDSDEFLVRMTPPRSREDWALEESPMYRTYALAMNGAELAELHKDPADFVKKILRSS